MAETELSLPAESEGRAPGRGRMEGRRVLIVGAGQRVVNAETDSEGNGRAMAMLCAREGAHVACADIDVAAAEATVSRIVAEKGKAFAIQADGSKEADVARMFAAAEDVMGGLDGLVCNVGVGVGKHWLEGAPGSWDFVLGVNLRGPMLQARAALARMSEGGSIVFISSIAGLVAGSRLPAYDSSKAALGGLMRHTAFEGARKNIRANVVAPGLMDTPLGRLATQGRPSRGTTNAPLRRQGTGWETAYAALFLLSNESAYVTGQILAVDGGLSGIS